MSNRFFEDEDEAVHPTARAWLERIRGGQKATFTLWRKRDGLTFKPAKIYITFETSSGPQRDHDDWDVDINDALVREGVRAESVENEAQRLSLMLRYWFSKPEERFGPGFFEGVLVEVLQGPEFSTKAAVTSRLNRIHSNPPSRTDTRTLIVRRRSRRSSRGPLTRSRITSNTRRNKASASSPKRWASTLMSGFISPSAGCSLGLSGVKYEVTPELSRGAGQPP